MTARTMAIGSPDASRDTTLGRALHADPFWRFASAKEMTDELQVAIAPKRAPNVDYRRAARSASAHDG